MYLLLIPIHVHTNIHSLDHCYAYPRLMYAHISFAEGARALPFVYTVRTGDDSTYFKHTGSDALELYENATIKRASTHPTTDALINLPVSEGGTC